MAVENLFSCCSSFFALFYPRLELVFLRCILVYLAVVCFIPKPSCCRGCYVERLNEDIEYLLASCKLVAALLIWVKRMIHIDVTNQYVGLN